MREEWKDIAGYEGYYKVSSFGRVKRLEREVRCNTGTMIRPERILKPYLVKKTGYFKVTLSKNSHMKRIAVHKLVVNAFIENLLPKVFTDTNHRDGNKENNNLSNLELCTRAHNVQHAYQLGLISKRPGEKNHFYGKKHTEETKENIRKHRKGKHRQYHDDGIYHYA